MVESVVLPGLVVEIEARIDRLERGIARANQVHRRGSTEMETRARQSSRRLEDTYSSTSDRIAKTFERLFSGFAKGSAALAGVGAAAMAFKEIADSVAEVDREARKASVSTRVWQQWRAVAIAAGVSVDSMTDSLKDLNINSAEFALTGGGTAAEAFTRLGLSAADVAEKLKDPNRFLDDLIGRIQKLSSAEQALNLDEIFGGGGEELAKALGLSVEQIQKIRSEATTFTEQQIRDAKRVSREWDVTWDRFTIRAKAAAIDGVNVATRIATAIREAGESVGAENWLSDTKLAPGALDAGRQAYDQRQQLAELSDLVKRRGELMAELADMTPAAKALGFGDKVAKELKDVDDKIREVQQALQDTRPAIQNLTDASKDLSPALVDNTAKATNFKNALAELKAMVPELKAELDSLAQSSAMETAYSKAARSATSWGELMQINDIASRARSVATFGNQKNMLDLIGAAEGTDKGRGYNETLDYGRWTGGAQDLTSKTLNEILALQKTMLADPANRALYQDKAGNNVGSSALGRYQITSTTLKDMMRELGLAGDRKFDADTQDEIARALMRRRGDDPAGLKNEWEGLRRVDDSTIRNAYNSTPTGKTALEPSDSQKAATDLLTQQADARRNLNQAIDEGLSKARFEQSLSGVSDSQKRVELELYERLTQLKRDGVTLSDAEVQALRQKIAVTDQLNAKNKQVSSSTEGLVSAQRYFADGFTSSLSGLLTGTQTLQGAIQGLLNSLIDAALQAALLGKGPLAGLFGGGTGTGIFGALFGFELGGFTGAGGKNEPAGIVHKGEYVMSAAATKRIGVGNLEAAHRAALKNFSSGGYVGNAAPIERREPRSSNATVAQAITINAPVTVSGSSGTPEQNSDLAAKMAKKMEGTMRGVVCDELRKQLRPSNMLGKRVR